MAHETKFLISLALTIGLETAALYLLLRFPLRYKKESIPARMIIFAGFIVSFATLPYVWFIIPFFLRTYIAWVIAGESFAFILEGIFYNFILKVSWKHAFLLSFACNAFSFLAGEGLKAILPPGF
jgi:hypothetical protein